jgi:hypothetical protein
MFPGKSNRSAVEKSGKCYAWANLLGEFMDHKCDKDIKEKMGITQSYDLPHKIKLPKEKANA